MSKGVNICMFIGHLGQDPEVRYSQSGVAVANLSLAVGEKVKKNDKWEDHTEWVRAVLFGKTAEAAANYLKKGSQVCIRGRMRAQKYQDRDGNDRWSTQIVCDDLTMLGGGGSGGSTRSAPQGPSQGAQMPAPARSQGFDDMNDDIPF